MNNETISNNNFKNDKIEEEDNPSRISAKIIEQVKKSGEFDKYRRQMVDDYVKSSELHKLIEKCKGIIEEKLQHTSDADLQRHGINQLREYVRGEIKRRKLVDNSMNHVLEKQLKLIGPTITKRMDEIVRAQLGIPLPPKEIKQELPDTNLELIDMEVSSGEGSSRSNTPEKRSTNSSKKKSLDKSIYSRHPLTNSNVEKSPGPDPEGSISRCSSSLKQVNIPDFDVASTLLENADSISSTCSSSLSCNASEEDSKEEQACSNNSSNSNNYTSDNLSMPCNLSVGKDILERKA